MVREAFAAALVFSIAQPAFGAGVGPDSLPGSARRLVICLDGVSYEDFHALQSRGAFSYMKPASRLIAPFPSLTNPALARILLPDGGPPSPGYEDRYYSLAEDKMKGGLLSRFTGDFVEKSFRRQFDFHPPGFLSAFEYAAPPLSCMLFTKLDLWRGVRSFRKSPEEQFLAYVGPTDCAAHTGGRGAVRRLLRGLDKKLGRLVQENPDLRLVLFSDHGNDYRKYRRVDLGKALKAAGYRMESRLKSRKSVVLPRYGLIGAAALHVHPEEAEAVARIAAAQAGVHFAAVRMGSAVRVFAAAGEARIEKRDETLLYLPESADPFDLGGPRASTPEEWFEETRDHPYPDAVNRVWTRSEDVVLNPAAILVSFDRGHYAGSRALDLFVALKATHGSLDSQQSLGFVASSEKELPAYVRSREVWEQVGSGRGEVGSPN